MDILIAVCCAAPYIGMAFLMAGILFDQDKALLWYEEREAHRKERAERARQCNKILKALYKSGAWNENAAPCKRGFSFAYR